MMTSESCLSSPLLSFPFGREVDTDPDSEGRTGLLLMTKGDLCSCGPDELANGPPPTPTLGVLGTVAVEAGLTGEEEEEDDAKGFSRGEASLSGCCANGWPSSPSSKVKMEA